MKIQITRNDINEMVYAVAKSILREARLLNEDTQSKDATLNIMFTEIPDIDLDELRNDGIDVDKDYKLEGEIYFDPGYDVGDEYHEDFSNVVPKDVNIKNYNGFDVEVLDNLKDVDDFSYKALTKYIYDPENWEFENYDDNYSIDDLYGQLKNNDFGDAND